MIHASTKIKNPACDWEHGEYYYGWNGDRWFETWRFGMSVTDRERWLDKVASSNTFPNHDGKKVGDRVGGHYWVYFGGECW